MSVWSVQFQVCIQQAHSLAQHKVWKQGEQPGFVQK